MPIRAAPEFALAPYTEFKHINLADYTPDQSNVGSITSITQDYQGFLWVGGENGLARYDGHNLLVYRTHTNSNSISANYIQHLLPDGSDYLWVGTVGGIDRLNFKTGFFDHVRMATHAIPSNDATGLTFYQQWLIVATSGGLGVIDRKTLAPYHPAFLDKLPKNMHILCVFVFQDTLWLGTTQYGLFEVNLLTNHVTHYSPATAASPANITPSIQGSARLPHNDIRTIFSYDGRILWLASLGGGLIKLDRTTQRFTQYAATANANIPFVTNDVWGVTGDSQGYIWVGTDSSGLWRIEPETGRIEGYLQDDSVLTGLDSNKARVVFEDNTHNIWIGSFVGILNYYNRDQDRFTYLKKTNLFHKGLNSASLLALYPAGNGQFWVGTEGGLNLVDPHKGNLLSFNDDRDILTANTNTSGQGLAANPVLSLEGDDQGYLWVGTWGGGAQSHPSSRPCLR